MSAVSIIQSEPTTNNRGRKTGLCAVMALALATAAAPASSTEVQFLGDMSGQWSGSGKAYLKNLGNVSASCNMKADSADSEISLSGKCGVLFFSIGLGLQLKDEGENQFTGLYTGSRTGPAKLQGVLEGNRLVMDITWNGEVNGDRDAKMVLERTGTDSFTQTVTDVVRGEERTTSQFVFVRM